jgi:hypothetical protein
MVHACPVAQAFFNIGKHDRCPAFKMMPGGQTHCELTERINPDVLGIGKGCCIKATAMKDGQPFNFADLPAIAKIGMAYQTWCNDQAERN